MHSTGLGAKSESWVSDDGGGQVFWSRWPLMAMYISHFWIYLDQTWMDDAYCDTVALDRLNLSQIIRVPDNFL